MPTLPKELGDASPEHQQHGYRHSDQGERGEEDADHQHLGRDPELHDQEGEEHEAIVEGRFLRAGNISKRWVKNSGGMTKRATDAWPNMTEVTMAGQ